MTYLVFLILFLATVSLMGLIAVAYDERKGRK